HIAGTAGGCTTILGLNLAIITVVGASAATEAEEKTAQQNRGRNTEILFHNYLTLSRNSGQQEPQLWDATRPGNRRAFPSFGASLSEVYAKLKVRFMGARAPIAAYTLSAR